jgi:hypothetical protein
VSTFDTGQEPRPENIPSQPPKDVRDAEAKAGADRLREERARLAAGSVYVEPEAAPPPLSITHRHHQASAPTRRRKS